MRPGSVIAERYRLERLLGHGSMGSVWKVEDLRLGHDVALKLLHAQYARSEEARLRFEREAKSTARLHSAHIATVTDHGVLPSGIPYLAMQYLSGETLAVRLARVGRLTLPEVGTLIVAVCKVLSQAHEQGLVHRDIKPDNLFFAREGDEEVVKVLDFGVAKATDSLATEGLPLTVSGMAIGTPSYMSPEQAQGLRCVGPASDLWSLGVVAFECITGRRPFDGRTTGSLFAQIVVAPIPQLMLPDPGARGSSALTAWAAKALERDPEQRFHSAKEMADAFEAARGATARQESSASHSEPSRKTWLAIALAAVLIAAALATGLLWAR